MLAKKITYTNYNGENKTGTYYFHLNKADLIKWMSTEGDYTIDQVLTRLTEERNGKKIMEMFETLLKASYGIKSLDGEHFIKNEEVWQNFYNTEAYSVLFTELVTDGKKAAEFINNIIPKELSDSVMKAIKDNPEGIPDTLKDYVGPMLIPGA